MWRKLTETETTIFVLLCVLCFLVAFLIDLILQQWLCSNLKVDNETTFDVTLLFVVWKYYFQMKLNCS